MINGKHITVNQIFLLHNFGELKYCVGSWWRQYFIIMLRGVHCGEMQDIPECARVLISKATHPFCWSSPYQWREEEY